MLQSSYALIHRLGIGLLSAIMCACIGMPCLYAKENCVYGLRNSTGEFDFVRVDLEKGVETIVKTEAVKRTIFEGSVDIDTRRDHYSYQTDEDQFARLELETGHIERIITIPKFRNTGFRYHQKTDSYIAIVESQPLRVAFINAKTLEYSDTEFPGINPNEYFVRCNSDIDDVNNLYMTITVAGNIWIYDIEEGTLEVKHELGLSMSSQVDFVKGFTFNNSDGKYYNFRVPSTGQSTPLNVLNPITGEYTTRRAPGAFGRIISAFNCSIFIHAPTSTFYVPNRSGDGGLWAINLKDSTFKIHSDLRMGSMDGLRAYNPVDPNTNSVTGTVHTDINSNCQVEAEETPLLSIPISFGPTSWRSYTRGDGSFKLEIPFGEYDVIPLVEWPWKLACQAASRKVTVNREGFTPSNLSYFVQPVEFVNIIDISLSSGPAVVGRQLQYTLNYVNKGTQSFNGTLRLEYDTVLNEFESTPAAQRQQLGLSEWDIQDLAIGANNTVHITLQIPPDITLQNQELCAFAQITVPDGALVNENGQDEDCIIIRNSYDPNDISVAPRGLGPGGAISVEDSTLAYTIRFQNIGLAHARNIVILDTLDANLNINSLSFGAGTHDYTVSLLQNRVLEFRFDDIYLTPKELNEARSHGRIKYEINLNSGLPLTTEIRNRAAIYFDFNPPVITNTVVNTLVAAITSVEDAGSLNGLELRSPSPGLFVLHRDGSLNARIEVFTVLGHKIFEQRLDAGGHATIDLRAQPSGRYLVRYADENGVAVRSVAVLR